MKSLLALLIVLLSTHAFALTRSEVDGLLRAKNTSLAALEQQGARLMPGENTGHGRAVAFSKVRVIFTEKSAIFKNEIEAVSFQGAETVGNIESLRVNGGYILKEDVKATLILGN